MTENLSQFIAQLKERVESEMDRLHIPGVALGIISGDQALTAGFGVTNIEHPLPVDEKTLFQVGSITKTVTATAAMRLVCQGQLSLDAPLRRYLPELRLADLSVAQRVTLRHVFSHTGGWLGDYFDDLGPGDDALARIVERMADLPQETPLGEIWSYNNAGFYLAGRIIERITGKTYEAAVHDLVLEPLGMDLSFFFPGDLLTYRFASGHDAVYAGENRPPRVMRPWAIARTGHAVGGLSAPVQDMLRYARFEMGDGRADSGERLLPAEILKEMHTPAVQAANGEWLGVSWFIRDVDGVRIIRHGGATNGQMATFQVVPERQFALVVLTNSDRGSELYTPLTGWVLEQHLGLKQPAPQPVGADDAALRPYSGRYQASAQDVILELKQGGLELRYFPKGGFPAKDSPPQPAPPPVRVAVCGEDRIIFVEEPGKGNLGEFLRLPDGRIGWLRIDGRVHRRVE